MNKLIVARHNPPRRLKPAWLWLGGITALGLVFVSGVFVVSHGSDTPQSSRPMPTGQFQADARSVLAALDFLLRPDPTLPATPTIVGCNSASFAFQSVPAASVQGCRSNQADTPIESLTNTPARS